MAPHMERVLVSLGLILVLEAVATEAALILFLGLVSAKRGESAPWNEIARQFIKGNPTQKKWGHIKKESLADWLRTSALQLSQTSWVFWDSIRTCRILGTWRRRTFACQGASAGWRQTRFANA